MLRFVTFLVLLAVPSAVSFNIQEDMILRVECDNKCESVRLEDMDTDPEKSTHLNRKAIKMAPHIDPRKPENKRNFRKELRTRGIVKTYDAVQEWKDVYEIFVPKTTALITIYAKNEDTDSPDDMPDDIAAKDEVTIDQSNVNTPGLLNHMVHMTDGNPGGIKYELITVKGKNYKRKTVISRSSLSKTVKYGKIPKKPKNAEIKLPDWNSYLKLWYGSYKKADGQDQEMEDYWKLDYDTASWTQGSDLKLSKYSTSVGPCTDSGWCLTQTSMSKKEERDYPFLHAQDDGETIPDWITNVEGTNAERRKKFNDEMKSGKDERYHTAYIARICLLGTGNACDKGGNTLPGEEPVQLTCKRPNGTNCKACDGCKCYDKGVWPLGYLKPGCCVRPDNKVCGRCKGCKCHDEDVLEDHPSGYPNPDTYCIKPGKLPKEPTCIRPDGYKCKNCDDCECYDKDVVPRAYKTRGCCKRPKYVQGPNPLTMKPGGVCTQCDGCKCYEPNVLEKYPAGYKDDHEYCEL